MPIHIGMPIPFLSCFEAPSMQSLGPNKLYGFKMLQLSKEFEETFRPMSDEEEREANAAVMDAAKRLVIAESLLMQAPVSMEDLDGADLGALLDCAHDTVHRLSQK